MDSEKEKADITPAENFIQLMQELLDDQADIDFNGLDLKDPQTAEEYMHLTPAERFTLNIKWTLISPEYSHSQHKKFYKELKITKYIVFDIMKQKIIYECDIIFKAAQLLCLPLKDIKSLVTLGTKVCITSRNKGNEYRVYRQESILKDNDYIEIKKNEHLTNLEKIKKLLIESKPIKQKRMKKVNLEIIISSLQNELSLKNKQIEDLQNVLKQEREQIHQQADKLSDLSYQLEKLTYQNQTLHKKYHGKRQAEGIREAKKAGKYKGRKPIPVDNIRFKALYDEWKAGKMTAVAMQKALNLTPPTFYRRVRAYEKGTKK